MTRVFNVAGLSLECTDEVHLGHFAKVTRLQDPKDPHRRSFALKEPNSDDADCIRMLANDAIMSGHAAGVIPDISVIASATEGHDTFLLTNWVDGTTLEQVIKHQGPFSIDAAAPLFRALCSKIAKLHDAGILHGDISSANVMLRGDDLVLIDFGTSRLMSDCRKGTVQARISVEITNTLSLFIFMITGFDDFVFRDRWDKAPHQRKALRAELRKMPEDIRNAVKIACARAFQREPDRRFKTLSQMMQALPLVADERPKSRGFRRNLFD